MPPLRPASVQSPPSVETTAPTAATSAQVGGATSNSIAEPAESTESHATTGYNKPGGDRAWVAPPIALLDLDDLVGFEFEESDVDG